MCVFLILCVLIAAPFVNGEAVGSIVDPSFGRLQPVNAQYMAMNPDGEYSFAYTSAESSRQERRNHDGSVVGKYTYTDPNGKIVQVDYTADSVNGFKAFGDGVPTQAPSQAPVAVQDTPAVKEAREKFLATYAREYARAQAQALANDVVNDFSISGDTLPSPDSGTGQTLTEGFDSSKIIQRDVTQNKIENVAPAKHNGSGYFYYVGVGSGQPYYVTAPPARSNTNIAVSVRASQLGAIPVSAVHDIQVPHYGHGIRNAQVPQPMYMEIGKDYQLPLTQYQYGHGQPLKQQNYGFRNNIPYTNPTPQAHYGSTTTVFTLPYFGYPAYIY